MTTQIKYLIPIALIKVLFVFLILQLFCTSCESDMYSDGPLVEIHTQLGDFSIDSTNIAHVGDTTYLEIIIESDLFTDEISGNQINIYNGEYLTEFSILNNEGEYVFPSIVCKHGEYYHTADANYYNASFGNTENTKTISDMPRLKLGLIFDKPGAYTFHYNNPLGINGSDEDVNIFYGQYSDDETERETAYAMYLFELGKNTINYGVWEDDEEYKETILNHAVYDQAIIDFKIAKNN